MYELPVGATRCAVCGSKRISRLFNKVGVIGLRSMQPDADWRLTSSSALQRSKALLQDSFDASDSRKASARETPTWGVGDREREVSTARGKLVLPSATQIAETFGLTGKGAPMSQMDIHRSIRQDRTGVPAVLNSLNRKAVPTVVHGRG